jgi:diketogulonate reductase-like aldo/keto reductase
MNDAARTTRLPSGEGMPVLGQGTWGMAEDARRRSDEIAALRTGIDLGMTLIDTAEMYADGGAESLVGEAIAGQRDRVFLVSKVLPNNAGTAGALHACERSLHRLGTDHLDLYLLHWRGPVPLTETVAAFTDLLEQGMIRHWGVSNFAAADLIELTGLANGRMVEADEVLYHLAHRDAEADLLPLCATAGMPAMAYAPLDHGAVLRHPLLERIAARHMATPAQIALAWVLRHEGLAAIPKASTPAHARENRGALDVHLTDEDLVDLDRAFPPSRSRPSR